MVEVLRMDVVEGIQAEKKRRTVGKIRKGYMNINSRLKNQSQHSPQAGDFMKTQNKIVAISLQGKDRLKMFAQYDGEQLLLIDAQKITGIFATRKEALIQDVKTLVKKGYTVVVDEKTRNMETR